MQKLRQGCFRRRCASEQHRTAATLARAVSHERLGQHFLADAGWRERIVGSLRAAAGDVWLEIGAGHGEMTALLAHRAARVIAVEVDLRLAERLRALAAQLGNVEVIASDILQLDLERAVALALGQGSRCKVYGNLPYYITSPILHRLFEHAERIESIDAVVQLEVAARMAAQPGSRQYGYLSVATQFYTRAEIILRIPPGAFRPRPKVTSALVHMRLPGERSRLGLSDENGFLAFIKTCFAQKRKTLVNNLSRDFGRSKSEEALRNAGLRPDARAEQLSIAQFAAVFRLLGKG
jgi:16S rRNA (adenine1518-N6/adenine1519-N6)-dimethyltransferase